MLISQGGSQSAKKPAETTKEEPEEPTPSPNVQFPSASQLLTSAPALKGKLSDSGDVKNSKVGNTPTKKDKAHDKASKRKDVLPTKDTEAKPSPAKIPKLDIIEEDNVLSTPTKSDSEYHRPHRGRVTAITKGMVRVSAPTPNKISPKPSGSKVVALNSLFTPKKEAPIVTTPKSTRTVLSKESPHMKSRLQAAKRLLTTALSSAVDELDDKKPPRTSSECSDIIPVIGKITPVNSTRAPLTMDIGSSVGANAGTLAGSTPQTPASTSIKPAIVSGTMPGISKLPVAVEKAVASETCDSVKVTKVEQLSISDSPKAVDVHKKLSPVDLTGSSPIQKEPRAETGMGKSKDKGNVQKAADSAEDSLPSREEIIEAATKAGLIVVACPSVTSSQTSYDPKPRSHPPLKTYSRKSNGDSISKHESSALETPLKVCSSKKQRNSSLSRGKTSEAPSVKARNSSVSKERNDSPVSKQANKSPSPTRDVQAVDQVQVSLEHNYSSPIKQDPNEQRRWEEALRAKCGEGQMVGSPKTPRGRQRVKVMYDFCVQICCE